jgi:hypothetical protein
MGSSVPKVSGFGHRQMLAQSKAAGVAHSTQLENQGAIRGGGEWGWIWSGRRDLNPDHLNPISAFVLRHTRIPPDERSYLGPDLSAHVRNEQFRHAVDAVAAWHGRFS